MAGIDTFLKGNQALQQGIGEFNTGMERNRQRDERDSERAKVEEAERMRSERISQVTSGVQDLAKEAEDPMFSSEDLMNHPAYNDAMRASAELGDPNLLASVDPIAELVKQRDKEYYDQAVQRKNDRAKRRELEAGAKVEGKKDARERRKELLNLQDSYTNKNKENQKFFQAADAYEKIKSSAERGDGAGDMSLVINYMKMLDPGSVVRETEFKTAAELQSWLAENPTRSDGAPWPSTFLRMAQKFDTEKAGAFLQPEQRKRFLSSATDMFSPTIDDQTTRDEQMRQNAVDAGFDPDRIVTRPSSKYREMVDKWKEEREAEKKEKEAQDPLSVEDEAEQRRKDLQQEGEVQLQPAQLQRLVEDNKENYLEVIRRLEASYARPLTEDEKDAVEQRLLDTAMEKLRAKARAGVKDAPPTPPTMTP